MRASVQKIDQLNYLIAERRRRLTSNSLRAYIRSAWPLIEPKHPFIPGWHIDAISDHLEAVHKKQIRNLLINVPPRHAKSTIVSVAFPSWVWTEEPEHRFIYGSYSNTLAKRDSVKTRNLVQSPWYRNTFNIDWNLASDQNEKSNFHNTTGGFRRATSVLASIIGEGGDTLVLDDPHSPRSVKSEVKREDELDWIDQEFFTRINDPKTTSKICIMQRLDQRDASAHLLVKGDWEHLMLPAEFEEKRRCWTGIKFSDPRTIEGEPLWRERFGELEVAKMKKDMGSKAWAGQGQQRPAPAEGNMIKREHLKFWKVLPAQIDYLALSVDLPFDKGGTYAVFQLWGRCGGERYLIKQIRGQMGFNAQVVAMKSISSTVVEGVAAQMISAKWVEKKANGAAILTVLEKEIPGLLPVNPTGSKEVRLEAVAPQFEAGNVYIPDPSIPGNEWVSDYIEELVTFPNALDDDQVDATSQALMKLSEGLVFDFSPMSMTGPSKWNI